MPKRFLYLLKILEVFCTRLYEVLEDFNHDEQIYILEAFLDMTKHALEYEHNEKHQMTLEEIYDAKLITTFKSRFIKADDYELYNLFHIHYLVTFTIEEKALLTVNGVNFLEQGNLTEDEYYYIIDILFYILTHQKRERHLNTPQSKFETKKRYIAESITINKTDIAPLIKSLSIFFDECDIGGLYDLLSGKPIKKKLVFLGQGNKFVDVFLTLKAKDKIRENKREIKEWICANFQYRNSRKTIKDFNEGNVHKILTGQQIVKTKIQLHKFV